MKTITVKGVGSASASPDSVVITIALESKDMDYTKAVEKAAESIEELRNALESKGFNKDDLKTSDFNVRTDYESVREKNGSYKSVFAGYVVSHRLSLQIPFDNQRLSDALYTVSSNLSQPEVNVMFTVKDSEALKKEMLKNAAKNAKKKASILCSASGVKLGELQNIIYDWSDISIYSPTRYMSADCCEEAPMALRKSVSINPEDVSISDNVTFVWEII